MKLLVIAPHFEPDVAPTGIVITRVVEELAARGHDIEVVTAFPWYREHKVEPGYGGRLVRYEDTPWGRITRINPFAPSDKRNITRRAAAFAAFSSVSAFIGGRGDQIDGVLAVSPPLTLGVSGRLAARLRHAPLVFNVQDVFPDIAIELGILTDRRLIAVARGLERYCYKHADVVTVLSQDLADNVRSKMNEPNKIRVIPNFVDTDVIKPQSRTNSYRKQYGLRNKTVVMYAGNVGLSQSLETVLDAATALAYEDDLVFVINGQGASREHLEAKAQGMPNVVFVDMQPHERLPEVLAAADIHLVTLRKGLGRHSVPSKTYSILAAGRPLIAAVDADSEIARIAEGSGAGVTVPPDDGEALTKTIRKLLDSPDRLAEMGTAGRTFVEGAASPQAVAIAYEDLFEELARNRPSRPHR
ncbi:MAG: glycosyltransferase family 4 protein [Actinomycetota bacterium]